MTRLRAKPRPVPEPTPAAAAWPPDVTELLDAAPDDEMASARSMLRATIWKMLEAVGRDVSTHAEHEPADEEPEKRSTAVAIVNGILGDEAARRGMYARLEPPFAAVLAAGGLDALRNALSVMRNRTVANPVWLSVYRDTVVAWMSHYLHLHPQNFALDPDLAAQWTLANMPPKFVARRAARMEHAATIANAALPGKGDANAADAALLRDVALSLELVAAGRERARGRPRRGRPVDPEAAYAAKVEAALARDSVPKADRDRVVIALVRAFLGVRLDPEVLREQAKDRAKKRKRRAKSR